MATTKQYKYLTPEQVEHFMEFGYMKLPKAFPASKAAEWTSDVWTRLGMDPNDKSTWNKNRINMPHHRTEPLQTFAPNVWNAICELLGGEDRVDPVNATWNDGLIVNLGTMEMETEVTPSGKELDNWHVDGDFFRHFLDSPEQALLVIPLFSDIKPRGGGTYISPDGISVVAKFLADHPEGVGSGAPSEGGTADVPFDFRGIIDQCEVFHEMHGDVGDVILMHPLMMHSASHNNLRLPRIITNPPVSLHAHAPFNFSRPDAADYSLVELKTIRALGADPEKGGFEFKITQPRQRVVPARLKVQNVMLEEEKKRLAVVKAEQEGSDRASIPAAVAAH